MNRVLVWPGEVSAAGSVVLRDGRFEHIRDVLGAVRGDVVRAGVIGGLRHAALVAEMVEGHCVLELGLGAEAPAWPLVDLLLALPRPKCLRRLWPQLAAMGVGRIYVANAEKVERAYWGSRLLAEEEYLPLLVDGLQQAGDTRLPAVSLERRLKPLVEDRLGPGYSCGCKLLAHPADGAGVLALPPGAGMEESGRVLLAVGPEGGWSQYELDMFERNGFGFIDLGWRTLRSDTACVALLAVVQATISGRGNWGVGIGCN